MQSTWKIEFKTRSELFWLGRSCISRHFFLFVTVSKDNFWEQLIIKAREKFPDLPDSFLLWLVRPNDRRWVYHQLDYQSMLVHVLRLLVVMMTPNKAKLEHDFGEQELAKVEQSRNCCESKRPTTKKN